MTQRLNTAFLVAHVTLLVMVLYAFTVPKPPSTAVYLPVDDRPFFECSDGEGCWNMALRDYSWSQLASKLRANEQELRTGNPHITGEIIAYGSLFRLSASMRAR
ncbi:MAG: hypothetical protein K2Z80_01215 [Xanthobacteraceae bacterium]|nr:hypothetical protein [Xanthobacteraceae bacterium]